jgi:fibronectin type 3 domain-containing protein
MEKITGSSSAIREKRKRFAVTVGRFIVTALLVSAVIYVAGRGTSTVSAAPGDQTPPTTPTKLRVTGSTSFSVSLSWNASSDNSGNFSYRIRHSWGYEATVPKTQTKLTWTSNLEAGRSYSFYVYAVDAAGNKSKNSNTVTVTLPPDTIPPTAPVLSVTDVGPTHVALSWSAIDDGPYVFYWIYVDDNPVIQGSSNTSGTIYLPKPETTYTFTAKARDNGINWSPFSDPVTATTRPSNPNDTIAPTTPTSLRASDAYDGEINVRWVQSTDDLDAQSVIRYDVYVNGVLSDVTVGQGRSIVYGVNGLNTISVIAVDTAGNKSELATTTITLNF